MKRRSTASRGTASLVPKPDAMASGRLRRAENRRGSVAFFVGRLVAALLMGLLLLALSGLLHTAAAATIGDGWAFVWATWLIAIIATFVVAFGAPTGRIAWGRLCVLNGIASAGLFVASTVAVLQARENVLGDLPDQVAALGLARPIGAPLGGAFLSAALGVAALLIAGVLFAISLAVLHSGHVRPDAGSQGGQGR